MKKWQSRGIDAVYGDAADPEFLTELPIASAKWIVSTFYHHGPDVTHQDPRLTMLKAFEVEGFEVKWR